MHKAILNLFVLLFALSIHSFGQTPQWKVVKEWHANDVTNPIPQTTVFTPESKGLYRFSGYAAGFVQSAQDTGWSMSFVWRDLTGVEGIIGLGVFFSSGSTYSTDGPQLFSPEPGLPVYVIVQATTPPPTGSSYDVAFTIEKLTN